MDARRRNKGSEERFKWLNDTGDDLLKHFGRFPVRSHTFQPFKTKKIHVIFDVVALFVETVKPAASRDAALMKTCVYTFKNEVFTSAHSLSERFENCSFPQDVNVACMRFPQCTASHSSFPAICHFLDIQHDCWLLVSGDETCCCREIITVHSNIPEVGIAEFNIEDENKLLTITLSL